MIKKLGKKQVHIWRRAWNIPPPPMEKSNPFHPSKIKSYNAIPKNKKDRVNYRCSYSNPGK